jgi:hypothetical protein
MRSLSDWPEKNPSNALHGLNYDQYKACWFNSFLWKARFEFMSKYLHILLDLLLLT